MNKDNYLKTRLPIKLKYHVGECSLGLGLYLKVQTASSRPDTPVRSRLYPGSHVYVPDGWFDRITSTTQGGLIQSLDFIYNGWDLADE